MPDQDTCFLMDLHTGQRAVIHSVDDDDPGFLRFVESRGLVPGVEFEVLEFSPYDNNLRLSLIEMNDDVVVGSSVAGQIQVEILESNDKEKE